MSRPSLKDRFVRLIVTGFYSSSIPPWPGTSGTVPAWLIAWFLIRGDNQLMIIAAAVTVAISIWSCGEGEKLMGHDSRYMVMDEWAGMFISLLFIPYTLTNYLIAFFVFRILDALKPFPVRHMEKAPGGWGVTFDDIGAAIQTNLVLQLYIFISGRFL